MILAHPSLLPTVLQAVYASNLKQPRIYQFSDRPVPAQLGVPDWRTVLPSASEVLQYRWLDFSGQAARQATATLNFSSGTTGLPKGVSISHHNVVANLKQIAFMTQVENPTIANARWMGFLPMYHAYGQLYSCLLCVLLDTPVYVMAKFEFLELLRSIQEYRITTIHLAPREFLLKVNMSYRIFYG